VAAAPCFAASDQSLAAQRFDCPLSHAPRKSSLHPADLGPAAAARIARIRYIAFAAQRRQAGKAALERRLGSTRRNRNSTQTAGINDVYCAPLRPSGASAARLPTSTLINLLG
jgi:hypothetical protein